LGERVTAPTAPLLTTVPRVELGAVGRWDISNMQGWEPSPDDMASAVAALDCPAVRRPVLKLGHSDGPGDPAIGYIDNMAVTEDGQVLVGDYAGIPAWLAAEDGNGQSVLASAYPDRSGEWEHDYVCQLGHTHPFVLHAMALLGVIRPGIGTLQSLHDLYSIPPEMEPIMTAASLSSTDGKVSAAATTDDVRRAYYDGPGSDWNLYIREMYIDPPELIVQNDEDSALTRVAYTIAGSGAVTFADPQAVKVKYVNARAAAEKPALVYASHAESRPGSKPAATQQTPAPTGGGPTQTQEGSPAVAFSDEQLTTMRQQLGIAADADEATILAALGEALVERAEPPVVTPPAPVPAPVPVPLAASTGTPPAGAVVIDSATLELIQAQARRGEEAFQRMAADERDRVIETAVKDGKIARSRVTHWQQAWKGDPDGSKQALASMPKNLVPVELIGKPGDPDALNEEFASLFPPKREA
jgi:hypothetical protein